MINKKLGFTLLEVLLFLCIFSITAVCIYSCFSAGLKMSQRANRENNRYKEISLFLSNLSKEIENMRNYNFSNSYPEKKAFKGEKDEMIFILSGPQGLRMVRYYLMPAASSQVFTTMVGQRYRENISSRTIYQEVFGRDVLLREEMKFVDYLNGPSLKGEGQIISTNIKHGGLRFFYGHKKEEDRTENVWKNSWSFDEIPANVRIEIDFFEENKNQGIKTIVRDVLNPTGHWGI